MGMDQIDTQAALAHPKGFPVVEGVDQLRALRQRDGDIESGGFLRGVEEQNRTFMIDLAGKRQLFVAHL